MKTHRILLVDDEPAIVKALTRELRRGSAEGLWTAPIIEAFTDPVEALARACETSFALAISDFRMPGMDGVALLSALREQQPACMRVIISGQTDHEGLLGAINQAQIARFISKPWHKRELLYAVRQLLQAHKELVETAELADQQRLALGQISAQEAECRRLERLEPGLTKVEWSSDGAYVLDALHS